MWGSPKKGKESGTSPDAEKTTRSWISQEGQKSSSRGANWCPPSVVPQFGNGPPPQVQDSTSVFGRVASVFSKATAIQMDPNHSVSLPVHIRVVLLPGVKDKTLVNHGVPPSDDPNAKTPGVAVISVVNRGDRSRIERTVRVLSFSPVDSRNHVADLCHNPPPQAAVRFSFWNKDSAPKTVEANTPWTATLTSELIAKPYTTNLLSSVAKATQHGGGHDNFTGLVNATKSQVYIQGGNKYFPPLPARSTKYTGGWSGPTPLTFRPFDPSVRGAAAKRVQIPFHTPLNAANDSRSTQAGVDDPEAVAYWVPNKQPPDDYRYFICPHCNKLNSLPRVSPGTNYRCGVCRELFDSTHAQGKLAKGMTLPKGYLRQLEREAEGEE